MSTGDYRRYLPVSQRKSANTLARELVEVSDAAKMQEILHGADVSDRPEVVREAFLSFARDPLANQTKYQNLKTAMQDEKVAYPANIADTTHDENFLLLFPETATPPFATEEQTLRRTIKTRQEERLKKAKEAKEAEEKHQADLNHRIESLSTTEQMLQALAEEKETVTGERTIIHQSLSKIYDTLTLPKLRALATTAASLTNTKDIQTEKSSLKTKIDAQVEIKKIRITQTMKGVLDSYNETDNIAAKTKSTIQIIATNFGVQIEDIKEVEEPLLLPEDAADVISKSLIHENTPKFIAGLVAIEQEQSLSQVFSSLASNFSSSATSTSLTPSISNVLLHKKLPYQIVLKLLDVEAKAALAASASSASVSISSSASATLISSSPSVPSSSLAASSSVASSSLASSSSAITTIAITPPQQDEFFAFITWLGIEGLVNKLGTHFPDVITAATSSRTVSPAFLDLFDKANNTDKRECLLVLVPLAQRSKVIQQYISSKATVSGHYDLNKLRPLLQNLSAFHATTFQTPFVLSNIADRDQYIQMIYEEADAQNIASYLQFLPTNDRNGMFLDLMKRCSLDTTSSAHGAAQYELLKKAFAILKAKSITTTLPDDDSQVSSAMLRMISLHESTSYTDKCTDAQLAEYEAKLLKLGNGNPVFYCMRDYRNGLGDEKLRSTHMQELYSAVRPEIAEVKERPPLAFNINIGKLGSSITGPQFVWDLYATDHAKYSLLLALNETKDEQSYILECMAQAALGLIRLAPTPTDHDLSRGLLTSIVTAKPRALNTVAGRFGVWNDTAGLVKVLDNVTSQDEFKALFTLVPKDDYKVDLANDYAKHVVSSDANFRAFFVYLQTFDPTIAPRLDILYQLKIIDVADDNEFKTFFSNVKNKADFAQAYANQNAKDPAKLRAFMHRLESCESEIKENNNKTIPKLDLLNKLDRDNTEFAKVATKIYEETKVEDMQLWLLATCRIPERCSILCRHVLLKDPKDKAKDDLFRQAMEDSKQTLPVLADQLLVGFPFGDDTQLAQLVKTIIAEDNQDNQNAWLKALFNTTNAAIYATLPLLIKACYGNQAKYGRLRTSIIAANLVDYIQLDQLDIAEFVKISKGFSTIPSSITDRQLTKRYESLIRLEREAFDKQVKAEEEMALHPVRCLMREYRACKTPETAARVAIKIMNAIKEPASLEHKEEMVSASSSASSSASTASIPSSSSISASASTASIPSSSSISSASAPSSRAITTQQLATELLEEKADINFILQAYDKNVVPFRVAMNKNQQLAADFFNKGLAVFGRDFKPSSPQILVLDLADNLSDENRAYIATHVPHADLNKVVPLTTPAQFSHLLQLVTEANQAAFITANSEALVAKINSCNSGPDLQAWINAIPLNSQAAIIQSASRVLVAKINSCDAPVAKRAWIDAIPAESQALIIQKVIEENYFKPSPSQSASSVVALLSIEDEEAPQIKYVPQSYLNLRQALINPECKHLPALEAEAKFQELTTALYNNQSVNVKFEEKPSELQSFAKLEYNAFKNTTNGADHYAAFYLAQQTRIQERRNLLNTYDFEALAAAYPKQEYANEQRHIIDLLKGLINKQGTLSKLQGWQSFVTTIPSIPDAITQRISFLENEARLSEEERQKKKAEEAEQLRIETATQQTAVNRLDVPGLLAEYRKHESRNNKLVPEASILEKLRTLIQRSSSLDELGRWAALMPTVSASSSLASSGSAVSSSVSFAPDQAQTLITDRILAVTQETATQQTNVDGLDVPGLLTEFRKHDSRNNKLVPEASILEKLRTLIQTSRSLQQLQEWAALMPTVSASSSLASSSSATSSSVSFAPDAAQTLITTKISSLELERKQKEEQERKEREEREHQQQVERERREREEREQKKAQETRRRLEERRRQNDNLKSNNDVPSLLAEYRKSDSTGDYSLVEKDHILGKLATLIKASHNLDELRRWLALPLSSASTSAASSSVSSASDAAQKLITDQITVVSEAEEKKAHEADLEKQKKRDWSKKDLFALLLTIGAIISLAASILISIFLKTSWLTGGLQIASALCVFVGALLTHLSKREKLGEKGDYKDFCYYRPGFAAAIITFAFLAMAAAFATAIFLVLKENALPSGANPINALTFAPMLGLALTGLYLGWVFQQTFSIYLNRKEPELRSESSTSIGLSTAYQITQSTSAVASNKKDRPIPVIDVRNPHTPM